VKRFGRVTKRDSPDFLISKESEPNTFQKASFLHELRAIDDVDARGKGLELANNLTKRHEKEVKKGRSLWHVTVGLQKSREKIKNPHSIGKKGVWPSHSRHLFHVLRLPEKHIFSK
jgi:hypothetical protein